jgi:hypothetical protein
VDYTYELVGAFSWRVMLGKLIEQIEEMTGIEKVKFPRVKTVQFVFLRYENLFEGIDPLIFSSMDVRHFLCQVFD